jgi:hypothetical protein
MSQNRIAKTWRDHVTKKLEDRYGLTKEQARKRADLWLQWIKRQPRLNLQNLLEVRARDQRSRSRVSFAGSLANRERRAPDVRDATQPRAAVTLMPCGSARRNLTADGYFANIEPRNPSATIAIPSC